MDHTLHRGEGAGKAQCGKLLVDAGTDELILDHPLDLVHIGV